MGQQPTVIVQFTRSWQQYNAGEQAGFPKPTADLLAKQRIASIIGEAKARVPDPPKAVTPKGFANPV